MRDTVYFIGLCAIGVALFSVFVAPTGAGSAESEGFDSVDEFNESEIRSLTFAEQNEARESASAPIVERNSSVDAVAQTWAEEMAETGYYDHGSYQTRLKQKTQCKGYAEVIAAPTVLETVTGFSTGEEYYIDSNEEAARRLVNGWMNSSQHRLIMTDAAFTHVGVGISITDDGTLYAVMDYCRY
jgi:uncharacterized protein YkwD